MAQSLRKQNNHMIYWLARRARDELSKIKNIKHKKTSAVPIPRFRILKAPLEFDINKRISRATTLAFLEKVRTSAQQGTRKIWIDFTETRRFVSGGTLLLCAEITRLIENVADLRIKCSLPKSNKAAQVLQQIGLSKLLKTKNNAKCLDGDVVNWRSARGQGAIGAKYDEILGYYDGLITDSLQTELYTGITEAMTNAHQHAYIDQRGDGVTTDPDYRPWWMFSQEKDGKLSVVFCDLGVGIPASLPHTRPRLWHFMDRLNLTEGRQIEGAVRNSQTRTRKQHRGKGWRQIIETISSCDGGKALILSNKGWYSMESGKQRSGEFGDSIMGTVIYWQMPLPLRSAS